MRTKKQILDDYDFSVLDGFSKITMNQRLILEVLLDIRESLRE